MNTMIAVGVDPGFTFAGGSAEEALAVGAFALVGLIFLFAAGRLCRRSRRHAHVAHYATSRR